jgi:hypothetical protein
VTVTQDAPAPKVSITGLEAARLCIQAAILHGEGESYEAVARVLGFSSAEQARKAADVARSMIDPPEQDGP